MLSTWHHLNRYRKSIVTNFMSLWNCCNFSFRISFFKISYYKILKFIPRRVIDTACIYYSAHCLSEVCLDNLAIYFLILFINKIRNSQFISLNLPNHLHMVWCGQPVGSKTQPPCSSPLDATSGQRWRQSRTPEGK